MLRRLENWLHQHIFKVGWLTTKDFHTTTILYYTFLLPGVVLYEVVFWLMAGLFNVRAERAIQWPQPQEIGRLELNFVRLAKNAHPLRVAAISISPLIVGILAVWYIANNIFNLPQVLTIMSDGTLRGVSEGLRTLTAAPDFWLWFYIAFTISNTMFPNDLKMLRGWRIVGLVGGVIVGVLLFLGVGNAVITNFISGPLVTILNVLSGTLTFIILMNIFVVLLLSIVENTIERITGDSADFRNGKMVIMTREERLAQQMKELERERQQRERRKESQRARVPVGPPSIYNFPLPIPADPTLTEITPVQQILLDKPAKPANIPQERESRAGAAVISPPDGSLLPASPANADNLLEDADDD